MQGERITKEAINIVKDYIDHNLKVLGLENNKIKVVKNY